MVHAVKSDLTQPVPSERLASGRSFGNHIRRDRPCEEWTEIQTSQKLLKVVATVSGHVFLGSELCRREEYLDASIDFAMDLFIAIGALKRWPKPLRFVAKYWIPQIRKANQHRRRVHEFLIPVLRERRARQAKGSKPPNDMLQWLLQKSNQFSVRTDEQLAETQLILGMAAIHTTIMAATQT